MDGWTDNKTKQDSVVVLRGWQRSVGGWCEIMNRGQKTISRYKKRQKTTHKWRCMTNRGTENGRKEQISDVV